MLAPARPKQAEHCAKREAGRPPLRKAASDTRAMLAIASTASVAILEGPPVASPIRRPSASRTRARQLVPPPSIPRKYAAATASPVRPRDGGIMPIHYQYRTEISQTPANNPGLTQARASGHSFVIQCEFPSVK